MRIAYSTCLKHTEDGCWDLNFEKLRLLLEDDDDEEDDNNIDQFISSFLLSTTLEDEQQSMPATAKRTRRAKAAMMHTKEDGTVQRLDCRISLWYKNYVEHPLVDDPLFQKKFRMRFRLPYAQFTELSSDLEESEIFLRWKDGTTDAVGFKSVPISLLLLCSSKLVPRVRCCHYCRPC